MGPSHLLSPPPATKSICLSLPRNNHYPKATWWQAVAEHKSCSYTQQQRQKQTFNNNPAELGRYLAEKCCARRLYTSLKSFLSHKCWFGFICFVRFISSFSFKFTLYLHTTQTTLADVCALNIEVIISTWLNEIRDLRLYVWRPCCPRLYNSVQSACRYF